jgi:hypothetical protein
VTAPPRPLTREAVGWIVRRACTRAGLEPFGPHRLRHNAACAMIGAKVPLAGIAQALRHRSHGLAALYARAGIEPPSLARPGLGRPPGAGGKRRDDPRMAGEVPGCAAASASGCGTGCILRSSPTT